MQGKDRKKIVILMVLGGILILIRTGNRKNGKGVKVTGRAILTHCELLVLFLTHILLPFELRQVRAH